MEYSWIKLIPLLILTTSYAAAVRSEEPTEHAAQFFNSPPGYYYNRRTPNMFGYRFTDGSGSQQEHEEETNPAGSKTGSYSYVDPSGIYRRVEYVADGHGFRATVQTNEPGVEPKDPANVRILKDEPIESLRFHGKDNGPVRGFNNQRPLDTLNGFPPVNTIDGGHNTNQYVSDNAGSSRISAVGGYASRAPVHSYVGDVPKPTYPLQAHKNHLDLGLDSFKSYSGDSTFFDSSRGPPVNAHDSVRGRTGSNTQSYSTHQSSRTYTNSGSNSEFASGGPYKSHKYFTSSSSDGLRSFRRSAFRDDSSTTFDSSFEASTSGWTFRPGAKARRKRQRNYGARINSVVKIHVPNGVKDSHLIPVYRDR